MTEKHRSLIEDRTRNSAIAAGITGLVLIAMFWIISMMWEPADLRLENGRVTKCLLVRSTVGESWRAYCLAPEVVPVKGVYTTFRIKEKK